MQVLYVDDILTRWRFNETQWFGFVPSKPILLGYPVAILRVTSGKGKVKGVPVHAVKTYGASGGIATLFLILDTRRR